LATVPPVVYNPTAVLNVSYIHHYNPVNVPIIIILVTSPLHNPENPISLYILLTFSPIVPPDLIEFNLETIVSAG